LAKNGILVHVCPCVPMLMPLRSYGALRELPTAEVAQLLGVSPRQVCRIADRSGIACVGRRGQGQQEMWRAADFLSAKLKSRCKARLLSMLASTGPTEAAAVATAPAEAKRGAADFGTALLSDRARERVGAQAEILKAHKDFAEAIGGTLRSTVTAFKRLYNSGEIELSAETRRCFPRVSERILVWQRRRERGGGMAALADKRGELRRGTGLIDSNPDFRELVLAMVAHFGKHLRATRVAEALRAKFPDTQLPSATTIRAFIRKWHRANASLSEAMHNPDRWKGKYRVKIADADEATVRLNQEWQIDGTPGDVMLADGRHHILAIIDVYSRRMMFHVAPSEGTAAAVRLICRAMLAWGVPEKIQGDNGAGFISHWAQRFFDDAHIEYEASPPFTPEDKSFIESGIGVMSPQLLAMLPGFIGHSVAQRQELRARTSFASRFGAPPQKIFKVELTAAELQARLDDWSEHLYGNRIHSGLAGKSPNQVAAEYGGEIRRIGDERALMLLAEDAVARKVGREGIAVEGARFVAVELAGHVGETVTVFPDPSGDMGRRYIFRETARGREFLCIAENIDRLGFDRSNFAIIARRAQDRFIHEGRANLRKIKNRIKPETIIDAVLAHASATSPGNASVGFSNLHETAALIAASGAIESASIAALAPAATQDSDLPEIPAGASFIDENAEAEARWARYRRLRTMPDVSAEDRLWMRSYEGTAEWRAETELERLGGHKGMSVQFDPNLLSAPVAGGRHFLTDDELWREWLSVEDARKAGAAIDEEIAERARRFEMTAAWAARTRLAAAS